MSLGVSRTCQWVSICSSIMLDMPIGVIVLCLKTLYILPHYVGQSIKYFMISIIRYQIQLINFENSSRMQICLKHKISRSVILKKGRNLVSC